MHIYNKFPVRAVKNARVQLRLQFREASGGCQVFFVFPVHQENEFMNGKEISYVSDPAGLVFGPFFNQDAGPAFLISIKMFEQGRVISDKELAEVPVMLNAFSEPVPVYRFR